MGNALVVMAVPEEALPGAAKGQLHPIYLQEWAKRFAASVWEPPAEPRVRDWHRDPELRRQHKELVRQSLEAFCNDRLAQLDRMARTGWWILERARIRVVEFEEVGDEPNE